MVSYFHQINEKCGCFLYELDDEGYNVNEVLPEIEVKIKEQKYTDVILFTHGWNVEYNDDGSVIYVNNLIPLIEDERPDEMRPLYIAVKWPSLVKKGVNLGKGYVTEDTESEARHNSIMRTLQSEREIPTTENYSISDLDAVEKDLYIDTAKTYGRKFVGASIFGFLGQAAMVAYSANDIIFRTLTRRAYIVGSRGMHMLIAYIMKISSAETKIHLYGFSMGATVALAAAIGSAPGSVFRRKIHSMYIFQGAVDSKWLCEKKIFRPLCENLVPVAGPIVFTHAENDRALLGMNIGGSALRITHKERAAGYKGVCEDIYPLMVDKKTIHEFIDDSFYVNQGMCYNVDCKMLDGFHHHAYHFSEVVKGFIKTTQAHVNEEDYRFIDHSDLPDKFWTDIKVRTS